LELQRVFGTIKTIEVKECELLDINPIL